MKPLTSAQKIENLRMAFSIFIGIPADKIALNDWRQDQNWIVGDDTDDVTDKALIHNCGTVGCVGGWLSAHPFFKRQGLEYDVDFGSVRLKGDYGYDDVSWRLFGDHKIFNSGASGIDGKKNGLDRILWALYQADAISRTRYHELDRKVSALKK